VSVKLAIAKRSQLCQIKKICKKEVNRSQNARHGNKARRQRAAGYDISIDNWKPASVCDTPSTLRAL